MLAKSTWDSPNFDSLFEPPSDFSDVVMGSRVAPRTSYLRSGSKKIRIMPSEWVEYCVKIKDGDTGLLIPISFKERRYLLRPYNTKARKVLFFTSRQTEKSTTLGNKLLAASCMRTAYTSLYVSPSAMQTSVFSNSRISDTIDISPMVKAMTHHNLTNNILEREFINLSKIYLRYSYLTADRIRGLSTNAVFVDEIQDILRRNMAVIEETASHHKEPMFLYSGTPKTLDNTIESYWAKSSTQSEWCIPCEHHGTPNDPSSWHWNIMGEKNLGKQGPICDRCGNLLNPEHPYARWIEMRPGAEYEGYRICRLMVPWYVKDPVKWQDIIHTYERYPRAQFFNEVLALSYDSGSKPITRAEFARACDSEFPNSLENALKIAENNEVFMGIDWSGGETSEGSFTVLSVLSYCRRDSSIQVIYVRRFNGPFSDTILQLQEIQKLIRLFKPRLVGTDYGMGVLRNDLLVREHGPARILAFQYVARAPRKIGFNSKLRRFMVFRSAVMSDVFNAIKTAKIRFPKYDDMVAEQLADDFLSIYAEYSNTLKMLMYDTPQSVPDDTFHSVLFGLLASMMLHKRRDIIMPVKGDANDSLANVQEYEFADMYTPADSSMVM